MSTVERNVLEIVNEVKNQQFRTLDEAVEEYGVVKVFDIWLRSKGIAGYTGDILSVLDALGVDVSTEEGW